MMKIDIFRQMSARGCHAKPDMKGRKEASKQASEEASKEGSKEGRKQASKRGSKQGSKLGSKHAFKLINGFIHNFCVLTSLHEGLYICTSVSWSIGQLVGDAFIKNEKN